MARLMFKEIDVTKSSQEHLIKIYVVTGPQSGWRKSIENLEMVVEKDKIIVRGWASKRTWDRFYELIINDVMSDPFYKISREDLRV